MKICGAIFDMDGTLVDSLFFWKQVWKKIGSEFLNDPNFTVPEELDAKVRTVTLKECGEIIKKELNTKDSEEKIYRFLYSSIIELYKKTKLKKNAEKILKALKEENIKMCVASATDSETVKKVLKDFKIEKYFEGVVSCADSGIAKGKESPLIYEKALGLIKSQKEKTVVFEDSFAALETAKKDGFITVGVFDENNYEQERVKKASDVYIDKNENIFDALQKLGEIKDE